MCSHHKFASANRGDGEIILTDGQIHLVFSGSLLWSQSAKGNARFLLPNIVKRVHASTGIFGIGEDNENIDARKWRIVPVAFTT